MVTSNEVVSMSFGLPSHGSTLKSMVAHQAGPFRDLPTRLRTFSRTGQLRNNREQHDFNCCSRVLLAALVFYTGHSTLFSPQSISQVSHKTSPPPRTLFGSLAIFVERWGTSRRCFRTGIRFSSSEMERNAM